MNALPLFERIRTHAKRIALFHETQSVTYEDLLHRSEKVAATLLEDRKDLEEARVAFLLPAGADYVAAQWGTWQAGGIAVPLSLSATETELEYTLVDSQSDYVLTDRELSAKLANLAERLQIPRILLEETEQGTPILLPEISRSRRAMILYTSGTTSKPKGVVSTHANIQAQIDALIRVWRWQAEDRIPLFLPLHHVHGIINILCCALWSGASVEPFARFDEEAVLQRVADKAYSVFMAVPTIYVKLIEHIESLPGNERMAILEGFRIMRLMVSGSAALPVSVHEKWTDLTGQHLLERYGMTEIGMALSNPYEGHRRAGSVGQPLPGVDIRLMSEANEIVESDPGEIQVRGPGVFREYWNRPEATQSAFRDGWFLTGDMAVVEDGYYRILGRTSVDIIKSGGYKLSALEIESALLDHSAIRECAVVGVPDDTWGETVAVAVVVHDGESLDQEQLQSWCKERMSSYKIPRKMRIVQTLPRNAMGKVTKPKVAELFR